MVFIAHVISYRASVCPHKEGLLKIAVLYRKWSGIDNKKLEHSQVQEEKFHVFLRRLPCRFLIRIRFIKRCAKTTNYVVRCSCGIISNVCLHKKRQQKITVPYRRWSGIAGNELERRREQRQCKFQYSGEERRAVS